MTPQITFLGAHELRDRGGAIVPLPTRKCWALLGFLTQSAGREIPRDELAALFWPRGRDGQGRASLRQELAVLRKALERAGVPPFDATKDAVRFDIAPELADTRRMETLLAGGGLDEAREAAALYRGEFLAGIAIRSDPFDEWLWLERQRLKNLSLLGQLRLLREDEASGHGARAIETASAILTIEPTQEQAHRALMRLYRRSHRRAEALRQFRHCADVLRRDLDTEPSQATLELASDIRGETVPGDVAETGAARGTRSDRMPERRPLSLLVAGIADIADLSHRLDPGTLAELQAAFCRRAAEIVGKAGGSVISRLGGRLVACFGYPRADEHDCDRAVRAGLALARERIAHAGMRTAPSCGLACGDAMLLPGPGGAAGIDVAGAALHRAEALQAAAHVGTLLVSGEMRRRVSLRFELRPGAEPGSHEVTGVRRPAWPGAAAVLPALVGRDDALAELLRLWDRARGGRLLTAAIHGEAGIGKSRLAAELLRRAAADGATAVRIAGAPLHRQAAFHALRGSLVAVPGGSPAEGAAATPCTGRGRVTPLLDPLQNRPAGLPEMLRTCTAALRAHTAQGPLVLLAEDLQWIDPATGEVLVHLTGGLQDCQVLLLATQRPEPRPAWAGRLKALPVTLGALRERDARRMAEALVPEGTGAAALDALVERSAGVPRFVAALALEDAPGEGVPECLKPALQARLDRLETGRDTLDAAAAIGRSFDRRLLARVTGLAEAALDADLRALQAAGLIYRIGRGTAAHYAFADPLLQEMALGRLPVARRAAFREQMAEASPEGGRAGAGTARPDQPPRVKTRPIESRSVIGPPR